MTQPDPTQNPRIELDLNGQSSSSDLSSRRNRPLIQAPQPALPKIEPLVSESDFGSDETERTVGIFFLLSAIPGLISLLLGHGAGGLISVAIPIYLGVGLLRKDDFVHQWVTAICLVQLIIGPLSLVAFPSSWFFILGGLAQNGGLLILVSGKSLSKQVYWLCLSAVSLGMLISIIGSFIH